MTDWERVDKLRGKGVSWETIALDERVGFHPPEGTRSPALALKGLYLQRRSRRARSARAPERGTAGSPGPSSRQARRRRLRALAFAGILMALAGAVPFGLSYTTSLIGAEGGVELLLLVALAGVGILGVSVVLGGLRVASKWKGGVVAGALTGVLVAGAVVGFSIVSGCPNLTPATSGSPGPGWESAANPLWTQNGEPMVFFLGSIACPYCSASSWAVEGAVWNFTTSHSGLTYGVSKTMDAYPQTPEVRLDTFSASGPYISWDDHEGNDPNEITTPPLGCPESAYVNTYDALGSIPFLVVGGVLIHQGSFVDPAVLSPDGVPLTPQQIVSDLGAGATPGDGSVCGTILSAQYWLEAYFWHCDVLANEPDPAPPNVESNPYVITDYDALR